MTTREPARGRWQVGAARALSVEGGRFAEPELACAVAQASSINAPGVPVAVLEWDEDGATAEEVVVYTNGRPMAWERSTGYQVTDS